MYFYLDDLGPANSSSNTEKNLEIPDHFLLEGRKEKRTTNKMKVADSAAKKDVVSKDKVRESLHILQPSATEKENLVAAGRMLKSTKQTEKAKTKNVVPKKTKLSSSKPKKLTSEDKPVETTREEKIKIEVDLTSTAGPSENYWKVLAERRQISLDDALEKIRTLEECIEILNEENKKLKEQKLIHEEMLTETKALVEVLQEMIDNDGSGINNSLDDSVY